MEDKVFPTFYHINDYNEPGYEALPRYLITSYPLVLWSPSGRILERCYRDNRCPISPDLFLKFVEDGYIHIIGREWWFNKEKREKHNWKDARWFDGFDDRIVAILREREKDKEVSPVRIVEDERGYEWAKDYMERKPEVVSKVERLIREEKVPQGVQEKASKFLENDQKEAAVENVLRDLCNHVDAKDLAEAKIPFLSEKDADFFRLMESDGLIPEIKKEMVISADMGRAIDQLADRLKFPERIESLARFVGGPAHRELATWFKYATEAANSMFPQDFDRLLAERLREDALRGQFSEPVRNLILQIASSSTSDLSKGSELMAVLAGKAIDADQKFGLYKSRVNAIYKEKGDSFIEALGMVEEDRQSYPYAA